jgi:hypothetical protein
MNDMFRTKRTSLRIGFGVVVSTVTCMTFNLRDAGSTPADPTKNGLVAQR